MNNKINCEIRSFQKEETIRKIKLESKQKKEFKSCQKNEETVISSVNDFRRELDELSNIYDRLNFTVKDNFISQYFVENYENYEADLKEIIKRHLDNLKESQDKNISIIENDENLDISEDDFQKSLYLKYEAKMQEIEARAELASLDAQIEFIKNDNKNEGALYNENLHRELSNDIGQHLKTLFNDSTTLELRSCVFEKLRIQQENVEIFSSLLEIWKQQCVRGKMRLVALNEEITTHEEFLGMLESIPSLLTSLVTVNGQLKSIADLMARQETESSVTNNQLLAKLKSEPSTLLDPLLGCLDSVQSTTTTCDEQRKEITDLLMTITDNIENSRYCLENIYENVAKFRSIAKNGALGDSNRMSFVTEAHLTEYRIHQSGAGKAKEKLKTIKEAVHQLGGDIGLWMNQ